MQLNNKHVLIVGSGIDLTGRRLQHKIDHTQRWDLIARLNRPYGERQDTGHRTDIIFTRWQKWVEWWPSTMLYSSKELIIVNEQGGITLPEMQQICQEIGHDHASIGLIAAAYCLNRGATVDVIGYGWLNGTWVPSKRYTGKLDKNPAYNWDKEHTWLQHNVNLL